jgi:hypothetical protein
MRHVRPAWIAAWPGPALRRLLYVQTFTSTTARSRGTVASLVRVVPFVLGGALYTIGVLWLTSYLEHRGYAMARHVMMSLLFVVPGPLYSRLHPAWRERPLSAKASRAVGAATGVAIVIGFATVVGITVSRDGTSILTARALTAFAIFTTLFAAVGALIASTIHAKHVVTQANPDRETTLREVLDRVRSGPAPSRGLVGTESDWLPVGQLDIRGSRLQIVDLERIGREREGVIVSVPRALYLVEARVMTYAREPRIARLRVHFDLVPSTVGARAGRIDVSLGAVAICDVDSLTTWARANEDGWEQWLECFANESINGAGEYPCEPAGTTVFYVASGFGAGTFPAFHLMMKGGHPIGIEVEFIRSGAPYPFDRRLQQAARPTVAKR